MTENDVDDNATKLPERTRARKAVVQFLYAHDLRPDDELNPEEYLNQDNLTEDTKQFGRSLIDIVVDHLDDINPRIESLSENWQIDRMSVVDRNIIRLGIAEILYESETPRTVVINECVELAKQLGSRDSHEFVNAILDRIEEKPGSE